MSNIQLSSHRGEAQFSYALACFRSLFQSEPLEDQSKLWGAGDSQVEGTRPTGNLVHYEDQVLYGPLPFQATEPEHVLLLRCLPAEWWIVATHWLHRERLIGSLLGYLRMSAQPTGRFAGRHHDPWEENLFALWRALSAKTLKFNLNTAHPSGWQSPRVPILRTNSQSQLTCLTSNFDLLKRGDSIRSYPSICIALCQGDTETAVRYTVGLNLLEREMNKP